MVLHLLDFLPLRSGDVYKRQVIRSPCSKAATSWAVSCIWQACLPRRRKSTRLLKYLEHNARKSGVEIVLNHKATAADIESMKPDEVIIATGGTPITLKIPGAEPVSYTHLYCIPDRWVMRLPTMEPMLTIRP